MMPVRSAPYYWLECDGEGCEARVPDAWGDTTAWSLREDAEYYAHDADWEHTADGLWLCPTCQRDSINYRRRPHLWKTRGAPGPGDIVLHHTVGPPPDEDDR